MGQRTLYAVLLLVGALWLITLLHGSADIAHGEGDSDSALKVGALMPLTGEFAMQAAAFREGLELGAEEVNGSGGIKGAPLELVIEDTHSDPKRANAAAQKFLSVDKVVAGITTSYPETEVGGKAFERAKVPVVALWDSSPEIDAMGEYIFALGPWVPSSAEVGSGFCINTLKVRKAVIVNTVEPWSESIAELFAKDFVSRGGEVLQHIRINPSESDFRTVLARIRSSSAEVIYAPLTHEIAAFHTQRLATGIRLPVLSADIIMEEHIKSNPKVFQGLYQSGIRDPARAETAHLNDLYRRKYGKDMSMPWFVATGYDAVRLIAEVMRTHGTEPTRIAKGIYEVRNFPGAAQEISISPGGSSPYYSSMFQIVDGKFKPL